ncbi:pilus assembly FimT family protein [Iodobacter fluviatilis]|uniref:Prepilin-type N-terminal cleavage/methylation domain-containing protein n=1 Tax=Iodobacter fluviatilis TaxID=537 RepID=A0A377Q6Z4_9NEIS|nr:prepilin-type N-terminal cleavage/methylation domain-containing protein [Iodobacter fluviatilis]TCU89159.1 prepilin-type N-terminal cleavage/methylation domain-containing protein [Iodobacter fluviatilis]STQ90528.1 Tfp pilus assembly protein FimT [Iodobacter fluviatilis]
MDSQAGKQAGFSLIELMVTIVIFVMLTLTAVSLGSSWLVLSDLQKSESVLKMAHSKAKALAIRNANGTAAGLQITGQKVFICAGNVAGGGCTASTAIWSAAFAKNAAVSISDSDSSDITTIQLDRTGLAARALTYSITEKGDRVNGKLV